MQERKSNHILLCLACEQMVFEVKQLQRKNWVRQPMKELCTLGVRQLIIKDLCVGVRQPPTRISLWWS
jgi:hypothetical protein